MGDMVKTIDDLGVETSTRYAQDRALLDETLVDEARGVSSQTVVTTTMPAYSSEFDALFQLDQRGLRFAQFTPPPSYFTSRRRLFAEQVVPALGSMEKHDAQLEKLSSFGAHEVEQKKALQSPLVGEVQQEQQILLTLLTKIKSYDEQLIDINSKRAQYQRG